MLDKSEIVACVATQDRARARAFYGGVLGLSLVAEEPWALVYDANGTFLRVQSVGDLVPAGYTVLIWRVAGIHALMASLAERGVVFERYASLAQDELGVWTAPDGTRVSWFRDPDGNILSLAESHSPAAPVAAPDAGPAV